MKGDNLIMDKKNTKFSIKQRLKSLTYVFNGLKILIQEEHNSRIHIAVGLGAIIAGFFLSISLFEWMVLLLAIGFVITLETINTVLENIADYVSPGYNEVIKRVKDLSAAAVFVGAFVAIIAGMLIFLPKIIALFE